MSAAEVIGWVAVGIGVTAIVFDHAVYLAWRRKLDRSMAAKGRAA